MGRSSLMIYVQKGVAQRPNQSLSVENNTVQVQSQNERKLKRKRKSNYLTANGHVTIDRLPYDDVFTSWSSDSIEIEEEEVQQSKRSLINVTIQDSDDRQENLRCLPEKGHISIERVPKDELPLSSRSSNENSILQKQVQQINQHDVRVSHVSSSELPSLHKISMSNRKSDYFTVQGHVIVSSGSPIDFTVSSKSHKKGSRDTKLKPVTEKQKEEERKKNQEYLTVHGHVTVDHPFKDELRTTESSSYNPIVNNSAQNHTQNKIIVSHVPSSELQSSPRKNDILKMNGDYLSSQNHAIVKKVAKDDSPFSRSIDNNIISSMYKEEERINNQEYLTAHSHVTVGHASKDELTIASGNNYNPTIQYEAQNAPQNYVRIRHRNLTENEFQPSFHESCALNKNGHYSATQNHVTVKIGAKVDSSVLSVINVNSSDKREPQQRFKPQHEHLVQLPQLLRQRQQQQPRAQQLLQQLLQLLSRLLGQPAQVQHRLQPQPQQAPH
ncbi:unnamed protein product [Rotaria socialis]|uniref:Uncharacterized protein n=1 Tax=Rotaria socialis TaxID=392032 RepID=A0A820II31_9BILA|nr:unnamed protein product [Rotaria socialis]